MVVSLLIFAFIWMLMSTNLRARSIVTMMARHFLVVRWWKKKIKSAYAFIYHSNESKCILPVCNHVFQISLLVPLSTLCPIEYLWYFVWKWVIGGPIIFFFIKYMSQTITSDEKKQVMTPDPKKKLINQLGVLSESQYGQSPHATYLKYLI